MWQFPYTTEREIYIKSESWLAASMHSKLGPSYVEPNAHKEDTRHATTVFGSAYATA
jgi:hypothetical protein